MSECPTVVGMITSLLQSGGSIDSAIRYISGSGPRLSSKLFTEAVRSTDTKGFQSLPEGLGSVLSELPKEASGYRRSIMMCLSAAGSSDDDSMDKMLGEAAELALESVREMGKSYGASLTVPCMTVFGIGIMVPMILMSILPMLSVGGLFGSRMMDEGMVVLVTLILVPSMILMVSVYIRNKNPFLIEKVELRGMTVGAPLLISVPMMLIYPLVGDDPSGIFLFSVAPACVVTALFMIESVRDDRRRTRCGQAMMDSVFDLGNRMLSGSNFEISAVESLAERKECSHVSVELERELSLCRGDICYAIRQSVERISSEVCMCLCSIQSCSEKNNEDAGRLAVTLGRQMQNKNQASRELEMDLKSTTDMMVGTAMVFAPMVLGLSISMMGPISKITGYVSFEGTALVLETYLVELCALISILVSSLGKGEGLNNMVWRFCLMCPISLLVFAICTSISI